MEENTATDTLVCIDLGQGALDIPEDVLQALGAVPFFAEYLADEIESAGDLRSAAYNSLNVDQRPDGAWSVTDIDSLVFAWEWDGKRWVQTRGAHIRA